MSRARTEKNYVSIRLDLPDHLNDWVNVESQKRHCSKRNFLMLLIENKYKKTTFEKQPKHRGEND